MPGGRPRLYERDEDRLRERNRRRREQYRRRAAESVSRDAARPAEAPFQNIFISQFENTGGSHVPDSNTDVFADLTNTLNNLSVEEDPSKETPQLSTLDFIAVEEDNDEEEHEDNRQGTSMNCDGEGTNLSSYNQSKQSANWPSRCSVCHGG